MATLLIVEDDKQTNEAICEYFFAIPHTFHISSTQGCYSVVALKDSVKK